MHAPKHERAAKGTRKRCSVVKFRRKKRRNKRKKCGKQKNVEENREFPMRLITSWFSAATNNTSQWQPKIWLWPNKKKRRRRILKVTLESWPIATLQYGSKSKSTPFNVVSLPPHELKIYSRFCVFEMFHRFRRRSENYRENESETLAPSEMRQSISRSSLHHSYFTIKQTTQI